MQLYNIAQFYAFVEYTAFPRSAGLFAHFIASM